jgi:hypothetical protein
VEWPDGSVSFLRPDGLAVDAALTVHQGSDEVTSRPFSMPAGAAR